MFSVCDTPVSPWQVRQPSAIDGAVAARPPTTPRSMAVTAAERSHPARAIARRARRRSDRPLLSRADTLPVADLVDGTRPVVGDEERAVGRYQHVRGTPEVFLVTVDPAGGKNLLLHDTLAVLVEDDADDAAALIFVPVPGAVLGDEDVVLVLGPELVAGVEFHAERRHVRAQLGRGRRELRALVSHGVDGIGDIPLVAIGIAEVLSDLRDVVELVRWFVVAEPVARVLGEPVIARLRVDVAADAVAHAERHDL